MSPASCRDLARRLVLGRMENADDAFLDRPPAFAVAAAGRLGDLVEPASARQTRGNRDRRRLRPARLRSGGRACRPSIAARTSAENSSPVRRILPRRQMDDAFEAAPRRAVERQRMRAAVDDDEALLGLLRAPRRDPRRTLSPKWQAERASASRAARRIRRQLALRPERQAAREFATRRAPAGSPCRARSMQP